jgi:hypothetical protein
VGTFKNNLFKKLDRIVRADESESAFGRALRKSKNRGAKRNGYKGIVQQTREFSRIMNIPIRYLDLDDVTDITCIFRKPGGEMQLRPIQSASLIESNEANGLFAPISVGGGKELISLLLPEAMDSERAVIIIPSQLREQYAREIDEVYGPHFNLPMERIVRIITYSDLSQAKNTGLLDELEPDLIVCNEVHNLKRKGSARTKRFLRYMRENPHCRLAALSGTMTSRSILDYAHIIELALRKNSPLPDGHEELALWAAALDVKVKKAADPGVLKLFLLPEDKGNVRLGYRRRLVTIKGVIASQQGSIGTGLLVEPIQPPNIPQAVTEALEEVEKTWAYNGEVFASPISFWRFCRQMSSGFYLRWVWPKGAPDEDDQDWLNARAAWKKAMREKLKTAGEGMDSELLLSNAAERWRKKTEDHSKCEGEFVGKDHSKCTKRCTHYPDRPDRCTGEAPEYRSTKCNLYPKHVQHCTGVKSVRPKEGAKLFASEEYIAWKKVKGRYNPSPPTEAVIVSDFVVHAAIARARYHMEKGRTVIIWYADVAIGDLLEKASGFPRFGQGADASNVKEDVIICSIATQGTGKNLQHYNTSVIITMPTSGKDMEQLIGREHRPGQEADTVVIEYFDHTASLDKCMDDVIADAMYIEETNGGEQKILYADGAAIQRKKIAQRKMTEAMRKMMDKGFTSEAA